MTGGSTDIGQEIARRLASEEADTTVADVDPAGDRRELVEQSGRPFFSEKVDSSDQDAIHACAARVRSELGATDILANNAAAVLLADIEHVPFDQRRRTFAVDVDGAFLASEAFRPDLEASGSGRIVDITSSSHWTAPPPFASSEARNATAPETSAGNGRRGPDEARRDAVEAACRRGFHENHPARAPAIGTRRPFVRPDQTRDQRGRPGDRRDGSTTAHTSRR
ncbi:SDR family NAD(P)-dependent oxidoreductase [Streptomyces sp. NPDC048420]|uniref:SDR family NAD(P)-dependent oxidoreductase n=1 Tax=Streptomyces sp. NPDC048420 TaxID=3155755 RepID=UPI00343D0523